MFVSAVVNLTTLNLLREPTSCLLLEAEEVVEDLDRMSHVPMTFSVCANRTLPALPVCMWMTLLQQSLKTLLLLWDFCLTSALQKVPPSPPPEDCSLATEAELRSTARHAFSLHHNLKVFCCQVCTHTMLCKSVIVIEVCFSFFPFFSMEFMLP